MILFIIFLWLGGKKSKKFIEYSGQHSISVAYFKLYSVRAFLECRKIIISSLNCFCVKLCNQNLWREKITCYAHIILSDCTFRMLKQNTDNDKTAVWQGSEADTRCFAS